MKNQKRLLIIGGGAAGFFGAINFAERNSEYEVVILEKSSKVLGKVKVSGGGRCNVTNIISEPRRLANYYPRGGKELLGPFHTFSSKDTIEWFDKRGIKLKAEIDGRIFPVTDDSQTIIDCFISEAEKYDIKILTKKRINDIRQIENGFWKVMTNDETFNADKLLIASGNNEHVWKILEKLGHKIIAPIPSLFTFNINDSRLKDLAGISFENVLIKIDGTKFSAEDPLLITHWGLSGPAILKLSAWAARELNEKDYNFKIIVNFIPSLKLEEIIKVLGGEKNLNKKRTIFSKSMFAIPMRFWERLLIYSSIDQNLKWNDISKKQIINLSLNIFEASFQVSGKSTFKEEFVICGGISLKEIDFKTMRSRLFDNLYFAGEVLNIDAVTGGYNFQAAWTTAWHAAQSINK